MDIPAPSNIAPRTSDPSDILTSLKRHAIISIGVIGVLVLGLGGWAGLTQIAGAVVANGSIIVEGGSKNVQHPEGGVVKKIYIKEDARVTAGQLLVTLDDVAIRADLGVVMSQLRDAIGQQARLSAEVNNTSNLVLPDVVSNWPLDPELAGAMANQAGLLHSQKSSLDAQAGQLDEQIKEKQSEIAGLKVQQEANDSQLALFHSENASLDKLRTSGLVGQQRVNEMKRSQADLQGRMGGVSAAIASAQAAISQLQLQRSQLYTDFRTKALSDLQTINQSVAELLQKKIAAEQRLSRLDIRSPISGTVHDLSVHTVGGVITAGESLMMVVPEDNHLLINARVSPLDVDKMHVDQITMVRLSGLDARTAPQLKGVIEAISADLTHDDKTGADYYSVRIAVSDAERRKLPPGSKLVPGMPAEAFIQTENRSVWSYLVHPVVIALDHTFREN